MPRVIALNNHPYGSTMRIKGEEYDVQDADVELLLKLKRIRLKSQPAAKSAPTVVAPQAQPQSYRTRDMIAADPGNPLVTTGGQPMSVADVDATRRATRPRKTQP